MYVCMPTRPHSGLVSTSDYRPIYQGFELRPVPKQGVRLPGAGWKQHIWLRDTRHFLINWIPVITAIKCLLWEGVPLVKKKKKEVCIPMSLPFICPAEEISRRLCMEGMPVVLLVPLSWITTCNTLSTFYKKRFIRNASLIPEKNKKRGLVWSEKLRNAFLALWRTMFGDTQKDLIV